MGGKKHVREWKRCEGTSVHGVGADREYKGREDELNGREDGGRDTVIVEKSVLQWGQQNCKKGRRDNE